MRKINSLFLAICLLLTGAGQLQAQSKSALEDQAYDYLNNNDFVKAYEAFDQLHARYPKEIDYHFKLGICALSYPEKKERAIEIFQEMSTKNKTRESEFYLGRAYHANYKFDEALAVLNPLVAALEVSKKKEDKAMAENAKIFVNNCNNGKILIQTRLASDVVNLGSPINTKELEGVPVITADESMMIFTYVGKKSMGGKLNAMMQSDQNGVYLSDIYMSTRNADSTWKAPVPLTALNTKANDAAIGISPDGLMLFTFLSTNENEGDILVSRLNGTVFSTPEPLNANINTPEYWEGSCSISADGKYLYFSSERPGGLGGRDIYVSEFINDDWGPAINLGPKINTMYDEDAPFIHPDGVSLFFSSKGHSSIGGYDIMFSTKTGTEWSEPKSMGIPVNTTEDDSYYVINSRGDKGYFSSDRATADGRGSQDIYMVTPGVVGERLIVGLFKGTIYGDNKPIEARIDVVKQSKKENLGPYYSNKSTGKYLLTLKPGSVYKVKIFADGYEAVEEDIDLETMSNYVEKKKDFYFYSQSFAAANPTEIKKDNTVLSPVTTPTTAVAAVTTEAVTPKEEPKAEEKKPDVPKTEEPKPDAIAKKEEEKKAAEVAKAEEKKKKQEEAMAKAEEKKAAALAKAEEQKAAALAKAEEKKAVALAKAEEKKAQVLAKAEEKKRKEELKKQELPEEVASNVPCNGSMPELASLKGKSLNEPSNYKQLMDMAGDYCSSGLVFKVQVGAYRKPSNFKASKLNALGKIESVNYPDGITRFTQRQFTTLKEAEAHRQKTIAKGQSDSWIVAFVNGKRYTLEDFIIADFAKPVN